MELEQPVQEALLMQQKVHVAVWRGRHVMEVGGRDKGEEVRSCRELLSVGERPWEVGCWNGNDQSAEGESTACRCGP